MQRGKCSKTQSARGAREIAFTAIFISQLICWMLHWKENETTFPSSYGVLLQQGEQEPLVCYSNTYQLRCPLYRPPIVECRRPKCLATWKWCLVWYIVRCDICQQETRIRKHFREKRLTCRIPAPCHSIPTALAPFSVVIRRMMMQNVVCFSFKWNIQQIICEIKIAANAISRAPRAFFVFEHIPLCT